MTRPVQTPLARARRPLDLIASLGALVVILVVLAAAHSLPDGAAEATRQVAGGFRHIPRWLLFAAAVAAAFAAVVLLVAIAIRLVRYRTHDGANAIVSGVVAGLLAAGAIAAWHAFPGGIATAMLHGTDGTTFVRDTVIVAVIAGSDTFRYPGWSRYTVPIVAALIVTGVALGELTFLGAIVAFVGGLSVGWFTRWALRSSVRRPSMEALIAGLKNAGVEVSRLERDDPDTNELVGELADGRPIVLKVAGRDVHGARVAARFWSILRLRGAATGRQPISVRGALETEALASMMAANAGVLAPRVLVLAHFEPDTLVLARERLEGESFGPDSTPEQAAELFGSVHRLHEIGVAHRDLRAKNLICRTENGQRVGFSSLEQAVVGAGELVRRLDLAQLLTSVAQVLDARTAVQAMRDGYEPVDEGVIAAILQPVALSSWGWSEMRSARAQLKDVRKELIGERDVEIPETRIERFRWRTVVAVVALTVAAFLLVGQLSKVDLVGALRQADWKWFLVAVVASALTYLGSALNLVAFVPQRVSVLKATVVELAAAFLGLVTPPTVGHVAINGRFLAKEGVDPATTATAVALSQLVNFITTVMLLIVATLLTGSGVGRLKIVPSPRLLGVLAGLVFIGVLLVTVIPWTKELFRHRLWPRLRGTWPQLLDVLSQPLRMIQGVGGNLLLTTSYVAALLASLYAVGAHPPLIATAAVFMAGNTIGAAAPTPGGIGAIETVMAAGLAGVGIPAHEAVPAVLLFRIATFWLPIAPGYVTFVLLQRRGIL